MTDLSPHQRDILIAMLQGKRIEEYDREYCDSTAEVLSEGWKAATYNQVMYWLSYSNTGPDKLRISENQDEAVRLYGSKHHDDDGKISYLFTEIEDDACRVYIDISNNGFIVGGKIEDIAK